ncbi:replication factor [Burkholderia phage BcepSauron]|uniref:Replication factor n=1 Tax=Burkholderia phage BcepSauron TaxID=2530033 RepID=A0A482MMD1_9CAUD|nr:replication factor [Burkholderia phage BcepSauron]QBQ74422.1 replication factor [Burkholderia phage BcepSauron]
MEQAKPALFYRDGTAYAGLIPTNYDPAKGSGSFYKPRKCHRCGGAGRSNAWAYTGYTCYECGGSGQGTPALTKVYTGERLAKLVASATKRQAKAQEKRAAEQAARDAEREAAKADKRAAFDAEYPGLAGMLDEFADNEFLSSLAGKLEQWGYLTGPQAEAAQASVLRLRARAEQVQNAAYLGTVGERREFEMTIQKIFTLDTGAAFGSFGPCYLTIMRDVSGATVVHKGNCRLFRAEGDRVHVRAAVKEHKLYNDLKQTVITRPTAVN